ncbi:MAG: hypothetical protein AAFR07_02460 [Pseudomonadota bacterium]
MSALMMRVHRRSFGWHVMRDARKSTATQQLRSDNAGCYNLSYGRAKTWHETVATSMDRR